MRVIQTGYSHADQTLHFRVPLGGPFALWYRSARVPGFTPSLQARVPLTGAEPPDDLKKLEVSTSLDGFRREEKYKAAPHLSHTVVAPSPQDVTVRVEYRFRKGRATSERRLTLGRPDPRALGLGGLLIDGVPVVDGRMVRFADGGSATIHQREGELPMARARGALYVVRNDQVIGVHDAISGRRLWYGDDAGRLVGPDGSRLEVSRTESEVELTWRGQKTTLEIDGWLRAIHSPWGAAQFDFTEGGLLTRVRSGDWEERAEYDEEGRLEELVRGDSRLVFVRTPLPDGYRAAVSDGLAVDRRSEVRFVDGAVHREERCCGHGPTRTVQEPEKVTVYRPDGTVVTRTGGGTSRTVTTTLPSGATRSFRVTRSVRRDRTTLTLDGGTGEWRTIRDADSGSLEWRTPSGRVRRVEMDEEDRVVEEREYDGTVRRYQWDQEGVVIEGPGGRRRVERDDDGGTRESSALGSRSFAFGAAGLSVERGGLTVAAGDDGRVTVDDRPYLEEQRTESGTRIKHGPHRLVTSTADGATETVESEGELVVESGLDGRPVRVTGHGVDRTFEWAHGRLAVAATPAFVHRVSLDGAELLAVRQEGAASGEVSFERDAEGVLSGITILGERYEVESEDGVVVRLGPLHWELDPTAIRPSVVGAGEARQYHRYDEWGRRVELRVAHAGKDIITLRWTYDEAGRVATLDIDGEVQRYRYDGELLIGVDGPEPERMSYGDGRLAILNGTAVAMDPVGRPVAVNGHPVEMTPGGRISSLRLGDDVAHLGYNGAGELVSIEGPGGRTSVTRDALGRPVWIDGPGGTSGIVWGPDGPVARVDREGRTVERFLCRPGHRIPDLIMGDGTTRMVVSDHLGSPVALVDVDTGQSVRSSWSAYGERRSGHSLIGFAGGIQLCPGPDIVDMGARSYLPAVGRWAQWDPLLHRGGGTDLYGYAAGDPVNHIDPTGTTVRVCRDHEGLRHRWILTDAYESGQDQVQSGQWYEKGFNTEWVDHSGRRGTAYKEFSCQVVEDVSEDCVNRRIKPGTDIGVYLFEPMYRTVRVGNTGIDVPLPSICWNVVEDVIADCKILRGEDPSLMCRGMPALPPPEPDHTPDLGYTPDYESMQTPDRDHTPDPGYTPLDGGGQGG
jgi:RHS repeat-associated protein